MLKAGQHSWQCTAAYFVTGLPLPPAACAAQVGFLVPFSFPLPIYSKAGEVNTEVDRGVFEVQGVKASQTDH